MRDDLTARLKGGSADFAATVSPAPPEAIRARGNQRRRRQVLTAAVLAFAVVAGGAGGAYASLGQPDRDGHGSPVTGRGPASGSPAAGGSGRPDIVAVTTKGALVVLDPLSGEARRILVARGVAGGAVAVSPDGRTAYFAARHGCRDEIESVPLAGGRPRLIASGLLPAVSPDGKRLAFVRPPGARPAPARARASRGTTRSSYATWPAAPRPCSGRRPGRYCRPPCRGCHGHRTAAGCSCRSRRRRTTRGGSW